jgi:dTDP-glucose 4,6-dehydratase
MTGEKKIIVTGGAGFIGCNLVRYLLREGDTEVLILDKLVFPGAAHSLEQFMGNPAYSFQRIDLCESEHLKAAFIEFRPDAVMHLAAESHVDRSIDGPAPFIHSNIVGTFNLLEVARDYWQSLHESRKARFRFLHVSTDEVMGSLQPQEMPLREGAPYRPNSPYAASKAAADHLVRAWHKTYGLPVLVSNCTNNYGPYQFPEKLIPLIIMRALNGEALPVYGDGGNVRDWLYVGDHVEALCRVMDVGEVGEVYNIGGNSEKSNIEMVETICRLLDELRPRSDGSSYSKQIGFVSDRPGHDFRYALNTEKITSATGWRRRWSLESGLRDTVGWYLQNEAWVKSVASSGGSGHATGQPLGQRLGLGNQGSAAD